MIPPKIKILVDTHVFDNGYQQGTTTYIKGLYNALVQNSRFEITLCANNIQKLKKHFADHRFKFIQLPHSSRFKRLLIDYPKLIQKDSFDYAHFQYIIPRRQKGKCKFINTLHDVLFLDFPQYFSLSYRLSKSLLFFNSAKGSDIIFTVSEYSRSAISKHFRINSEKVYITYNAVNADLKREHIDIKEKYCIGNYLLYVSRFEPRKNHILLLRSYLELRLYEKKISLVFIGHRDSVGSKDFTEFINKLSATERRFVYILENISENELMNFYNQADAFIYPSLAEGFGIPPLEAAVNNCKVVCSNTTAMSDFNFFKYTMNPNSIEEMKNKISQVLEDTAYPYQQIRSHVVQKYNWEATAETFGRLVILDKEENDNG